MKKKIVQKRSKQPRLAFGVGLLLSCIGASAVGPFNPPGDPAQAGTDATSILAFPQRDFVSASGYDPADRVVVRVIHDPVRYPSATGGTTGEAEADWLSPDGDLVEVNHPGGFCWKGVTPDIRPGDTVEIEVKENLEHPERLGRIDRTFVRNVTAKRPVVVQAATPGNADGVVAIHGTAVEDTPGGPAGQLNEALLENRLVSPGNLFALNGRRTLRASNVPGALDGIMHYDEPGSPTNFDWTATYTGLSEEDVARAIGADSRGMWLGNSVAPATESTIYEIGALTFPGPALPCTAPLEVLPPPPGSELVPPTKPDNLNGTLIGQNQVDLTWNASTDNVGVTSYGVYRNGQAIFTVQNQDGSAPAPTTYSDKNIPPGTYHYHVVAFDEVGNASVPADETASFTTTIQLGGTFPIPINDPPVLPINIIAFPSRDFISPSGYEAGDKVTVQILRNGPGGLQIVSSSDGITPDPEGIAEVNHPGGSCWEGLTPDIRVGDIVRTIALNPASVAPGNDLGYRSIDQTTIAGVTAFKPVVVTPATPGNNDGVVQIHGTALGADGNPIPVDQLEQRMIATHGVGLWEYNNRRALRAASIADDGILAYDTVNNPMGVKWTATYSGLSEADVARMAEADTRIHWLGRDPLLLNEATIFENSPDANPPGPAGPGCTAPLEVADAIKPTMPGGFEVQFSGNQATLNWTPSTDDWWVAGYRVYDNGVEVANTGPLATNFTLSDLVPGIHNIQLRSFDAASPLGAGDNDIAKISSGLGNMYGNLSDAASGGSGVSDDVTAPSAPNITSGISAPGSATITWSESNDNVGVTEYTIYRDGNPVGTVTGTPPVRTFTETGLAVGTYSYTVDAADAAGNRSVQSSSYSITITSVPDLEAPSVPGNVTAVTPNFGTEVTVNWTASTDNVGVAGYRIYRKDFGAAVPVQVNVVNGSTTTYSESPGSGTYEYTVDAIDSAGNASAQSAPPATIIVASATVAAGHSIVSFPARDFISATGYDTTHTYSFNLVRAGRTFTTNALLPIDSGNTSGIIEANHPGVSGTCWQVNTPDMKPGDVIQIVDNTTGAAEQTFVMNVTAERPIAINTNTVVIHGTAQEADGSPIPVAQLEHRLVTGTANAFDLNGNRTLRAGAGGDGTLTYDTVNNPTGTKWTAVYTGLSANDVLRAVGGTSPTGTVFAGAESRAVWLGRAPLAGADLTIFENGPGVAGGPAGPGCTAPSENPAPAATFNQLSLTLAGTQARPVQQTSPTQTVTLSNGGGLPLNITNIYFAGLNPGDFSRPVGDTGTCPTAFPATLGVGLSCTVRVAFSPSSVGRRQANLSVTGNAANTTDLSVALSGIGIDNTDPMISLNLASRNFGTVNGGALPTGVFPTQLFTVTNSSDDPSGRALSISTITFGGANPGDFSLTANTCNGATLSPADPGNGIPAGTCTFTVRFSPLARGARSGTVTVNHNTVRPSGAIATNIALTGTGGNASVLGFTSGAPVKFSPRTNSTSDQTISLKNTGNQNATLNLSRFSVAGVGYTVRSTTCGTLTPSSTCSVVVRYTSTAATGTFPGTLTVTATNGIPPTASIALSATVR